MIERIAYTLTGILHYTAKVAADSKPKTKLMSAAIIVVLLYRSQKGIY